MAICPVCSKEIPLASINKHLDSGCVYEGPEAISSSSSFGQDGKPVASIFHTPAKRPAAPPHPAPPNADADASAGAGVNPRNDAPSPSPAQKRSFPLSFADPRPDASTTTPPPKKQKASGATNLRSAMPLAERMRPKDLDDIHGQDLVGKEGVLRGLIEQNRVPSMILWGTAGCGKTTIARVIATRSGSRFVEISATASGVGDCKRIFAEAKSELVLSGRKTILFCDEIHRFTKSQQDVFLSPVERGEITL